MMTTTPNNHDDERAVTAAHELLTGDLTQVPVPDETEQQRLLAALPEVDADTDVMVSRSIRLDAGLEHDIKAAAAAENVSASEWIRNAARRVLASEGDSGVIRLDDAIRALQRLPHGT